MSDGGDAASFDDGSNSPSIVGTTTTTDPYHQNNHNNNVAPTTHGTSTDGGSNSSYNIFEIEPTDQLGKNGKIWVKFEIDIIWIKKKKASKNQGY